MKVQVLKGKFAGSEGVVVNTRTDKDGTVRKHVRLANGTFSYMPDSLSEVTTVCSDAVATR